MNDMNDAPQAPLDEPHATPGHARRSRAKLLEALRRPSRGQLAGAVLLGLLGFAMVTQVNSNRQDDTYAGLRSSDLVQLLNGLNAEARRADKEIADLEQTRSQLTDSSQRRQAALKRATEESSTLGILALTRLTTSSVEAAPLFRTVSNAERRPLRRTMLVCTAAPSLTCPISRM